MGIPAQVSHYIIHESGSRPAADTLIQINSGPGGLLAASLLTI